jgi:acyl-CoA thioester hydrolase
VEGSGLIMMDAGVQYKAEAFLGDELKIEIGINDITKLGFDLVYRFTNKNNQLVAMVKTGMVFFDYSERRVQGVPKAFVQKINSL